MTTKLWEGLVAAGILTVLLVVVIAGGVSRAAKQPPVLTDKEKLALRNAQVEVYQAGEALKPYLQQYQNAQNKLNSLVDADLKARGLDPAQYEILSDLSIAARGKDKK